MLTFGKKEQKSYSQDPSIQIRKEYEFPLLFDIWFQLESLRNAIRPNNNHKKAPPENYVLNIQHHHILYPNDGTVHFSSKTDDRI